MELGVWVVDRGLIDRNGRRAGVVDDLIIELPEPCGTEPSLPRVVALQTGPMALSENLWLPLRSLARLIYRLLGLPDARPVEIGWEHVSAIDVVVHLDLTREEAGLEALAEAVRRRFIGRIPGS
jgi:sporulation protein YlmC with PRC-barrel domain